MQHLPPYSFFKPFLKSCIALLLLLSASYACASSSLGPKEVIEEAMTNIVIALEAREDKKVLTAKDRASIQQAVDGVFDYRVMAKRTLRKKWKELDNQAKTEFTALFQSFLEYSYSNRLSSYHGEDLVFSEATFKQGRKVKKAFVKLSVVDTNSTTHVEYRLYQKNSPWMVYDILIEGTSLIRTFQDDFQSIIKKKGFDGLYAILNERVSRFEAQETK